MTSEDFWLKVAIRGPDECWEWQGSRREPRGAISGYGYVMRAGRSTPAHRISYEEKVHPVPVGMVLDHLCRNPCCVNPAHLQPVTPQINTLRGEGPTAKNAQKTHCPRGHALVDGNLRRTSLLKGWRECAICYRQQARAYNRRTRGSRLPHSGEAA